MFNKIKLKHIPAIGLICAFISVIFWSSAGLCSKLANEVHALEVLTSSSIIQTIVYFTIVLIRKEPILAVPEERWFLLLRCFFGTASIACLYPSYRLIDLSDATTLRFTAPVFTNIFAFLILKEPFTYLQIIVTIVTVIGVFIIGRPAFLFHGEKLTKDQIIGILLALSAAITAASSLIAIRKLQKTPTTVVILWYSISGITVGFVALSILDELVWPTGVRLWLLLMGAAVSAILDQYFITLALQIEDAGPIAIIRAFSVVFGFIFGVTILDEEVKWTSIVGGVIIFACVIMLGAVKWFNDRKKLQQLDNGLDENDNKDVPNIRVSLASIHSKISDDN